MRAQILRCLMVVLVCLPQQAFSADAAGWASSQAFSHWMMHYYENPQPQRLPEALAAISSWGMADKPNAVYALHGFFAGIFRHNAEALPGWMDGFDPANANRTRLVLRALWLAGTPEATRQWERLRQRAPGLQDDTPPLSLLQLPVINPAVLDALWGYFFATGEAAPVARIASALPLLNRPKPENPTQRDALLLLTGGAATWSLISNAREYPRVREICTTIRQETDDPAIRAALEQVLQRAATEKPPPRRKTPPPAES